MRQKEITREAVMQWEEKHPALKRLNDATLDKSRGFAITRADAVALAGDEETFRKVRNYWMRSVLWLCGVTIEYEHKTKSYRFIEVDRHLIDRQNRILRGQERKHREEAVRLGVIRDADVATDHQRRLRALMMNQHIETAGKIEGQREFARLALTQPERLPRINDG
jgi:hypothetical protein